MLTSPVLPGTPYGMSSKTNMSLKDQRLQSFLGGWVKRLHRIEELESRLPTNFSIGTRGKKRALSELEWVQCSNPNCGKWRAVSRCLDSRVISERHAEWFCVMNTWDEALASCDAVDDSKLDAEQVGAGEHDVDSPRALSENSRRGRKRAGVVPGGGLSRRSRHAHTHVES